EEVFNGDDAAVVMREGVLSKACVEIFTPANVLAESFPNRQAGPEVRYGGEGWLARLSEFLDQCLGADVQSNEPVRTCAVKALSALHSLMTWAIPKAIHSANCVPIMVRCLAVSCISVQKVGQVHLLSYAPLNNRTYATPTLLQQFMYANLLGSSLTLLALSRP